MKELQINFSIVSALTGHPGKIQIRYLIMITARRISSYGLILAENCVLLSLLNRGPSKGKWNLVGGAIEFGESPEVALIREVNEEAGIKIASTMQLLAVMSDRYQYSNSDMQDEDLQIFGIIYSIQLPTKLKCKQDGDGESSNGCRWFEINDLEHIGAVPFVQRALNELGLRKKT